jgi:hypothetical protein
MDHAQQLDRIIREQQELRRLGKFERQAVRRVALAYADIRVNMERESAMLSELIGFARVDEGQKQISLDPGLELGGRQQYLLDRAHRMGYIVQHSLF